MNVLKPYKQAAIQTLVKNGISQHEISRKTGIDRKTVRKYQAKVTAEGNSNSPMATGSAPPAPQGSGGLRPTGFSGSEVERGPPKEASPLIVIIPKGHSACFVHHEWIVGEVHKGRNAMSIYQDLVEKYGFTHRYNSVKRYVRSLKKKEPEQYDRLEFLPGEEAQVDYGQGSYTLHPKTGKRRRPRLFVMTLRYSRKSFRKVVWNSSQKVWAQLHEEAFRYFGGVPQYVVLDNLKEGVIKPDIYEPELNSVYSAMLAHYGVVADPARVRDPDRKGTVENAIQHTQSTALKGREFATIEEQNQWLMHWEEKWAAPRIHGRAKRQVSEMFLEEKPFLGALPLQSFRYFRQEDRTVWDDGCIQVGDCYYSALPAPLYSKVMVRLYECEIEIYDKTTLTLIRRHFKSRKKGHVEMKEEDRIFNPSRQTKFFLSQAEKIGSKTKELCELLFKEQGRVGQRRMRGILSLAKKHSAALIEQASSMALDRCVRSSKVVREMVERLEEKEKQKNICLPSLPCAKTVPLFTQSHELIRQPHDYALFWETHAVSEKNTFTGFHYERSESRAAGSGVNQPAETIFLLSAPQGDCYAEGEVSPNKTKEEYHADVTS